MKRMAIIQPEPSELVPDQQAAAQIIREVFPRAQRIAFVEHGQSNLIAQVDEQYVFRFPRRLDMLARFAFEVALLEQLAGSGLTPVPKVCKKSAQPAFVVVDFLPGEHLKAAQIRDLLPTAQADVGTQLARFVYDFQQATGVDAIRALRRKTGVDEAEQNWGSYLADVFGDFLYDPRLGKIITQYYAAWQKMVAGERMDIVVHGDLHEQNILFKGGRLSGVLDFEFADVGSIEQECRTLYRFGEPLLHAFIERYEQLSGAKVRVPDIRTWAIVGELATFCTRTRRGQTGHPSYLRARGNLRAWLPDFPL